MLILAKSALALTLGFVLSICVGLIVLPTMRKLNKRHQLKNGTPTLGGLIFIIPPFLSILLLMIKGSIQMNYNLFIVLFVFLSYGLLGFYDDFKKIMFHDNKGLSVKVKFFLQLLIAIGFYLIYHKFGGTSTLEISLFHFKIDMGHFYTLFILFLLVGTTNAVNITDGLDGLCGGLSFMAILAYAIISCFGWITCLYRYTYTP